METKQNNVLGVIILVVFLIGAFFAFRYLVLSGGVRPSDSLKNPTESTPAAETETSQNPPKPPYVFLQVEGQECVSCVELKKNLETVKPLLSDQISFEIVNILDDPKFGEEFQISVLPTILIFDSTNQQVFRYEGSLSADQLSQLFTEMGVMKP